MNKIKLLLKFIEVAISNAVSRYYIRRNSIRKKESNEVRVAFLVHSPEIWDKLQPLYDKLHVDRRFKTFLILVPSFDRSLSLRKDYGYEKDFFESKYGKIIIAYDNNGNLFNIKDLGVDYVFYQDHYDEHYPKQYRSKKLVKYTRICYIPYGYALLRNFTEFFATHRSFLKNVYVFFAENLSDGRAVERLFTHNLLHGIQHVEYLGFPALENYMRYPSINEIKTITWTPRWAYDERLGGSHFFEYKEVLFEIKKNISKDLIIRPHPMMFENFKKMGLMTDGDIVEFKKTVDDLGIVIDDESAIDSVLMKTDLLITDISSIIVSFFVTGRPIIYCNCNMEPNEDLECIMRGMYIANSEDDIKYYISNLLNGNDYLKQTRKSIIMENFFDMHHDSSNKIIEYLYKCCQ